ncbi:hypothetical protein BAUCODRAFT_488138 [Baudoinia panamericana UAMH 10762]|uniref:Uncharacterized protein n=1 Tax=Baudoinia panamericana (strain UAMH 10762) TaxID=717646 RepID=M2LQM9_BAUPA|nr:uncharacterized protein BAUCODRAFT_488138 [Baudoinia panamericana UAMH 10762]EMC96737.1 hypothetical protein BAUCODRAFT_488138 [Baudoinia panamericana UAMH 10762]
MLCEISKGRLYMVAHDFELQSFQEIMAEIMPYEARWARHTQDKTICQVQHFVADTLAVVGDMIYLHQSEDAPRTLFEATSRLRSPHPGPWLSRILA